MKLYEKTQRISYLLGRIQNSQRVIDALTNKLAKVDKDNKAEQDRIGVAIAHEENAIYRFNAEIDDIEASIVNGSKVYVISKTDGPVHPSRVEVVIQTVRDDEKLVSQTRHLHRTKSGQYQGYSLFSRRLVVYPITGTTATLAKAA